MIDGTYKNFDEKTPGDIYDAWLSLEERCDENVGRASLAVAKLERLVEDYGEDDANAAVYAFIGSDDARMLIDSYYEHEELGYFDMKRWYREWISQQLAYMPLHYGADDCYVEMRDSILPEVLDFEENRPQARAALDAFMESFCGDTFDGLFGFAEL